MYLCRILEASTLRIECVFGCSGVQCPKQDTDACACIQSFIFSYIIIAGICLSVLCQVPLLYYAELYFGWLLQ